MSLRARIDRLALLIGEPSDKCNCGFVAILHGGKLAPEVCPYCGLPGVECVEIIVVLVHTREEAARAVAAMKEAEDSMN